MMMNSNLILQAGQGADILGAMQRGNALAGQVNEQRRQNALAGFMRDNGAALMQGDPNALAGYAQFDPQGAMSIMDRQQERQWRADERDYQRQRDAAADRRQDRQFAMQDARYAKQDDRADQEWAWKVQQHAETLSAAEREQQAAQVESAVKMGLAAQTPEQWDQIVTQAGAPDLVGQFDNRQAITQRYMTVAEILKGQQPATPLSPQGKFTADQRAGLIPADAVYEPGGNTTVKVDMGGGAPGLGKLSTDFGYVMDASGNPVIDPNTGLPQAAAIPGSPAAMEAAQAAQKASLGGGAKAVSTDTIMSAADEARNLIGRTSTGTIGAGLAYLPESDAAEVNRQIDVMKSIAKIETLGAMRAASPTGGALGAVSDSESAMLAAAAGALDPRAGPERFGRQLDNYERTLLRIIHGPKVGDAIFEQTRGQNKGGGADGGVPSVANDADYDALPSGATFRDPDGAIRRKP